MSQHDSLYHVTYAGNVDSIASLGLLPGAGTTFGGAYREHALDKLFLTEPEGVFFWHHRVTEQVSPLERAEETPVVLRFEPTSQELEWLQEDVIGTEDASAAAYILEADIEPDRLEVWDGEEWLPLTYTDQGELVETIIEAAQHVVEDGEEWMDYDEDVLFPPELRP